MSRNVAVISGIALAVVTPRERRVSRNFCFHLLHNNSTVTPRERRVSRNSPVLKIS